MGVKLYTAPDSAITGVDVLEYVTAKVLAANADAVATAADRVQTGLDRTQCDADAVATAADAVATAADAVATAADRVQTGIDLDAISAAWLKSYAVRPTLDPSGNPIVAGALGYNTALARFEVYDGDSWDTMSSPGGTSGQLQYNNGGSAFGGAAGTSFDGTNLSATRMFARGAGNIQYNSAFGESSLNANTTGNENSAFGAFALGTNTTGQYNTACGYFALISNTTGIGNTAIGAESLQSSTTAEGNSAFGYRALKANTTGYRNGAIGQYSLDANTIGNHNCAFGYATLTENIDGIENTALGVAALGQNVSGNGNIGIGVHCAYPNFGQVAAAGSFVIGASYTIVTVGTTDYTAIGAASNAVGVIFTATGAGSGTGTASRRGNDNNIVIGHYAGLGLVHGANNTIIGAHIGDSTAPYLRTPLSAGLTGAIVIGSGDGIIHVDFNKTTASAWKFAEPVITSAHTVAALPTGAEGMRAYATNGRKNGEGGGAGTGVPVYYSNGNWRTYSDDLAVAA